MHFSLPSYQNDPVEGFLPIQNDKIHYLDITNDGLTIGLEPYEKAIEFWNSIEQRAFNLSAEITDYKQNDTTSRQNEAAINS